MQYAQYGKHGPMKSLLLTTCIVVALAVPAAADFAYVPLEVLAGKSEVVVVAEALSSTASAKMLLLPPDYPRPVDAWFRGFDLKVTEVIKADGVKVVKGGKISVLGHAMDPGRVGGPALSTDDLYPEFKKGSSYVLLLRKMADRDQLYLPFYPTCAQKATRQAVARVRIAADVRKWAWGVVVNGLQIACVPRDRVFQLRGPGKIRRRGQWVVFPAPTAVYVMATVALRNTSDKPVTVNLYQWDKFLSAAGADAKGATITAELYTGMDRVRPTPMTDKNIATVKPGEMIYIGPFGDGGYGAGLRLPAKPGEWAVRVAYTSKRAKGPKDQPLWTGALQSGPVTITMKPPAAQ